MNKEIQTTANYCEDFVKASIFIFVSQALAQHFHRKYVWKKV